MLSKLSYIGLTLLLIGLVCIAIGEVNLRNVNIVQVGREDDVWSYAVNLTRGTTYGIDISASDSWGELWGNGSFTQAMPVNLTIESPSGDLTRLQAFFYSEAPTSSYYKVGTPPAIVAVNYQNVDSLGLTVDSLSGGIRFMAKLDGPYNVAILQNVGDWWRNAVPDYILFSKEVVPDGEFYSLLAACGGVLCAVGGVAFMVSLFRSGNTKHKHAG